MPNKEFHSFRIELHCFFYRFFLWILIHWIARIFKWPQNFKTNRKTWNNTVKRMANISYFPLGMGFALCVYVCNESLCNPVAFKSFQMNVVEWFLPNLELNFNGNMGWCNANTPGFIQLTFNNDRAIKSRKKIFLSHSSLAIGK